MHHLLFSGLYLQPTYKTFHFLVLLPFLSPLAIYVPSSDKSSPLDY